MCSQSSSKWVWSVINRCGILFVFLFPLVGGCEEPRERQFETRQEGSRIYVLLGDDSLAKCTGLSNENREGALETVDYPIFLDAQSFVFLSLVDVVSLTISTSSGNEFDDDRGWIISGIGPTSQARPDDAIGAPPVILGVNVPFWQVFI